METRFEYTPEHGVVAPGTVVALGSGSFRVLADPSYGGAFVIDVELVAAAQDPSGFDDPTLVRFASTLGTLEIRPRTVLVNGATATGATHPVPSAPSLVLSRDKAGATRLATRDKAAAGAAVWFGEVHTAVSVFGNTPTVDVFFAPSVAKVSFRWCRADAPSTVWAGWWVPVAGSLAVPGLERRFDYVPGSFWANAQVDATAATPAADAAFVVESVDPTTVRAKFVLSVDVSGGSTSGAVVDVREGTASFGMETVDTEGPWREMFAVVDGHRQSVGVRFARASALSVVLASDGSTTRLSVRAASGASGASVQDTVVSARVATGGSRRLAVTVGASVARATLLWPSASNASSTAAPSGVDWAGWWSHVPVLDGPGPGVVTWDAALDGARYAPACAESGSLPWSAAYSASRIGEVRDAGMSIGAGDGYVVWDGSALVVVAEPRGPRGTTGGKGPGGARGPTGPTSTEKGSPGATGGKGPRGYEGERGQRGEDGHTGAGGDKGTDAKGATGPRGDRGATGSQGDRGPTGPTGGPTGYQGDTGRDGAAGSRGADGAQGSAGATGARDTAKGGPGDRGPTGARGESGATGAAGTVVGPTGPSGYAGHTGVRGKPGVPAFTGRYAHVARIPPCNVEGVVAAGSTTPTLAFSVPLATRTLAVSASTGVVLAAMRPYAATVGNYTDDIDTSENAAFFATGTGAVPLVVTYTLDAPVLMCGYELSMSGAVHKWTVELDGVVRDDRTEEMHALNSREFVRIALSPVSCTVVKLTIVSCAANAGVRLFIDHLGPP